MLWIMCYVSQWGEGEKDVQSWVCLIAQWHHNYLSVLILKLIEVLSLSIDLFDSSERSRRQADFLNVKSRS